MEKREEKNGGENPNNTNGDHTHNTPVLGNDESDGTGVTDPAVQAKKNGTTVVTNGKTDDNQNKDINQEVQMSNNQTPAATDTSIIPSEQTGNTDTSRSKGTGSSSELKKSNNETPDATDTSIIPTEKTGNTKASRSEGTGSSSEVKKSNDESPAATDTSITTLEKAENTNALKSEGTGSRSEVKKSNDESPAATDTSISKSEKAENTNALKSHGTGSSSDDGYFANIYQAIESGPVGLIVHPLRSLLSSCEVSEPMKEPPATEHDNRASQPEGGENRAPPPENKQPGSENLQSESGSSHAGHAGHAGEKGVEEIEAQKRDANGKSEEEMKTGSGANKDGDKEGQPKKKKAKEEGVKGEGGTEDAVKPEERVVKERPVSISLCTSAYRFNVEGLVAYLKDLKKEYPKLIKAVKVHELPYNDLDHYRFDDRDPVDVMILCHSINNRRFAITDVMDALYDEYLPYCARVVGKEKMGVIVHDFDDMRETVQSSRMSSFKYKQPKAFETTSLQITCGHIEKEEQILKHMLKEDRQRLFEFLRNASKHPEKIMTQRDIETNRQKAKRIVKQTGGSVASFIRSVTGSNEAKNSSTLPEAAVSPEYPASDVDTGEFKTEERFSDDRKNDNSQPTKRARVESQASSPNVKRTDLSRSDSGGDVAQVRQQSLSSQSQMPSSQPTPLTEPRSTSVSICSSAYQHNVNGLVSWLTNFKAKHPHMINDVRFRSLPYNDIDSFRFPQNDPVDVMVLCHSIQNRGFSITNVLNALYDKYLKYCHDVIGKTKLAVIVHDFTDLKPATAESRMESFRRSQPLTFKLVDTVIICGSLEDQAKLDMTEEDKARLIIFLERARMAPRENSTMSTNRSFVGSLFGFGKSSY